MTPFLDLARLYALAHQNLINRRLQFFSAPLIMLACLIVLACIHLKVPGFFEVDVAAIAVAGIVIYYLRLNWRLGLTTIPLLILLWWIACFFSEPIVTLMTLWGFLISLLVGCLLYIAGQFIEGKHLSFVNNMWQILLSPLFMAAELYFVAGFMKALQYGIAKDNRLTTRSVKIAQE